MLAIVNPTAGSGRALQRWNRIEKRLGRQLGPFTTYIAQDRAELERSIPEFLSLGYREFLVGGGDGTINAVLGGIMQHGRSAYSASVTVGAVGLGSSNDFHKPFRTVIEGIPCRLEFRKPRLFDAGRLDYLDESGVPSTRHWFVNASIGITAEANLRFNRPDAVLRHLKRTATGIAIGYAALRALLDNRARSLRLESDGRGLDLGATRNIGVVKNPHFAGSLRYDSPHEPRSGNFHVHHIGAVSRWELLRILARLSRGCFSGARGTRSWEARELTVDGAGTCFAVECDGEVVLARRARFVLMPRKVRLCP